MANSTAVCQLKKGKAETTTINLKNQSDTEAIGMICKSEASERALLYQHDEEIDDSDHEFWVDVESDDEDEHYASSDDPIQTENITENDDQDSNDIFGNVHQNRVKTKSDMEDDDYRDDDDSDLSRQTENEDIADIFANLQQQRDKTKLDSEDDEDVYDVDDYDSDDNEEEDDDDAHNSGDNEDDDDDAHDSDDNEEEDDDDAHDNGDNEDDDDAHDNDGNEEDNDDTMSDEETNMWLHMTTSLEDISQKKMPLTSEKGATWAAVWTCGQCTYENPGQVSKCEMCGLSSRKDWDLTVPTGTRMKTFEGIRPKEKPLALESSTEGATAAAFWACGHCTYENPIRVTICEMCSRTTGKSGPSIIPQTNSDVLPSELDELANMYFEEEVGNGLEAMMDHILAEAVRKAELDHQTSWACQICTFLNHPKSSVCEMCLEAKTYTNEMLSSAEENTTEAHLLQNSDYGSNSNASFRASEQITKSDVDESLNQNGDTISDSDAEALIRALMEDGVLQNYDKAKMAVELKKFGFKAKHCIDAAINCDTIKSAICFLQRKCELCCSEFPATEMVAMVHCTDVCCHGCAISYFSVQIKEKHITEAVCPICGKPNLKDGEVFIAHFNHLGNILKGLLDDDVYNLFQTKLRDFALAQDMQFHWCQNCENGFYVDAGVRRLECPECRHVFCIECKMKWEVQHERLTCEEFLDWKNKNSKEYQESALENYLKMNGLQCPNCKQKYDIAKGGCIHFKCLQCKHEFCGSCGAAFLNADNCTVSEVCKTLGLHAHHPRNCFFYTRDKDPADLEKLLKVSGVQCDSKDPSMASTCSVMEQREGLDGRKDAACGRPAEQMYNGLCRVHYVEYLCALVKQHNLDPVSLMEITELQQELKRNGKIIPVREDQETDQIYQDRLTKVVQCEIPLIKN